MNTELDALVKELESLARVELKEGVSIISLVANVGASSAILSRVFRVLSDMDVNAEMISQGASMTNISLLVPSESAREAAARLHEEFFGS